MFHRDSGVDEDTVLKVKSVREIREGRRPGRSKGQGVLIFSLVLLISYFLLWLVF